MTTVIEQTLLQSKKKAFKRLEYLKQIIKEGG